MRAKLADTRTLTDIAECELGRSSLSSNRRSRRRRHHRKDGNDFEQSKHNAQIEVDEGEDDDEEDDEGDENTSPSSTSPTRAGEAKSALKLKNQNVIGVRNPALAQFLSVQIRLEMHEF